MAYVSLYRKYRPQSFAEVVGQRHVTRTLANAITEDRLHHAYLFTGPRGTGKTSTARILAKAINCDEGPTAEPCQTCPSCLSVTDGSAVDVIELDMASHGGVDDARELRERALFAPARLRRKVYILDEVHMASSAAFNALLKLLEEPPGHVLFTMATTEPGKVLPTIMSRVQRLDFRRIPAAEVSEHISRICALEEVEIEETAVDAIVRAGDGSVRDTLSILEQVMSFAGRDVTGEDVVELLGHTPVDRVFAAVVMIADADLAGLLGLVGELLDGGHDLRRFALDLAEHLRDLLVLQTVPDRPDLVDASTDQRTRLLGQAPLLPRERLVGAIDVLGETLAEMRRGPARLPLELALAKIVLPAAGGEAIDEAAIGRATTELAAPARSDADDDRTAGDEAADGEAADRPDASAPGSPEPDGSDAEQPEPEAARPVRPAAGDDTDEDEPVEEPDDETGAEPAGDAAAPAETASADASGDPDLDALIGRWTQILDLVKRSSPRVHAILAPATPHALEGRVLVLAYPDRYSSFHAEQASRTENADVLRSAVQQVTGHEVGLRITVLDGDEAEAAPSATNPPEAPAEEDDVREAERATGDTDVEEAADRADALLRDELGAEPIDEGTG